MFKAFTGALSLALAVLVLNWILPEVLELVVAVAIKILTLVNLGLDALLSQIPR
jgi:hypothetical protein